MTIRWILIGDQDEPCGLVRHDSETKELWELDVADGTWQPGGDDGLVVLFYGKRTKPDTYLGFRPGVDKQEVDEREARRAVEYWGLSARALIDTPPLRGGVVRRRLPFYY